MQIIDDGATIGAAGEGAAVGVERESALTEDLERDREEEEVSEARC